VAADPATTAPHAEPVGVARADDVAKPNCSTESPGFGKMRSVESWVPQPFPMFATNILGRALKEAVSRSTIWVMLRSISSSYSLRFDEPAVRVTGAQFIYISRLPTLLNHDQARVADPVGIFVGIVNV
jgi:hypothetical protein